MYLVFFLTVLSVDICLASRSIIINDSYLQRSVLSVEKKPLTISCQANTTISYCWYLHPNGTEFAANIGKGENMSYWYNIKGLDVGLCEITLVEGNLDDSGDWKCHMGDPDAGLETVDTVSVRVAGPLAAVKTNIKANVGDKVTLHCITAGGVYYLKYCRFITPDGTAFNINEDVTEDKAILGQYYYPNNTAIYKGDCAVTISKLTKEHFGGWYCFGMIKNEEHEYRDYILLEGQDSGLSVASVAGIAVGVTVVFVALAAIGVVKYRQNRSAQNRASRRDTGRGNTTGRGEDTDRPTVESTLNEGRSSGDSDTSATRVILNPGGQIVYGASSSTAP